MEPNGNGYRKLMTLVLYILTPLLIVGDVLLGALVYFRWGIVWAIIAVMIGGLLVALFFDLLDMKP